MSGRNLTEEDDERKYSRVCEDWIEEIREDKNSVLMRIGR